MYTICHLILILTVPFAAESPLDLDTPAAAATAPSPEPSAPTEMQSLETTLRRVGDLLLYQNLELPSARSEAKATVQPSAANDLLLRMYASKDVNTRLRAVEGWATSGDPNTMKVLLEALLDSDADVQSAAARALQSWDAAQLFDALLPLLESQDPAFMAQAPRILPVFSEKLGGLFLDRLRAESSNVLERLASAYALGLMRYQPAAETLAAGIDAADASFSRTCAAALLELDPASRQKDWLGLLRHPDPEIALVALNAARRFGGAEALGCLARLAAGKTRNEEVLQLRAMQAVGEWPVADSIPMLINVMAENPRLASAVNKLLAGKTKQDFGPNAQIWSNWWVQNTGLPSPLPPPPGKDAADSSLPQSRAVAGISNP